MAYVAKLENDEVTVYDAESGSQLRRIPIQNSVSMTYEGKMAYVVLASGIIQKIDLESGGYAGTM